MYDLLYSYKSNRKLTSDYVLNLRFISFVLLWSTLNLKLFIIIFLEDIIFYDIFRIHYRKQTIGITSVLFLYYWLFVYYRLIILRIDDDLLGVCFLVLYLSE